MSKKTQPKHSNAGKGDKNRITNLKKYADNWEKIFGKKGEKTMNLIASTSKSCPAPSDTTMTALHIKKLPFH